MEDTFVRLKLPPEPGDGLGLERITIERLDYSSDMARIETVPMRQEQLDKYIHKDQALAAGQNDLSVSDRLSLWDIKRRKVRCLKISSIRKKLQLRRSEVQTLSENMVFWRIHGPSLAGKDRVFNATASARALSKEIHEAALGPGSNQK